MDKIIVGSAEWCAFPNLAIPAIRAKVDSGAKTSSIHAFNISQFKRDNSPWVTFEVHPLQNDRRTVVRCEAAVIDRRNIKSSNGTTEKRFVISTALTIGNETWDIELTLTNRDSMGFRMLLGREAMKDRMLVDPANKSHLGIVTKKQLKEYYELKSQTNKGLKIGVLATNQKLYSNQRLMEAASERGHEVQFINIENCSIKMDTDVPEIHYRGGSLLNDLDAVITRIRPSLTFYGCALTRQFESMGIYTINESTAISQSRDKLLSLQLLIKKGLNIPTTSFANSTTDTSDLIDMVGGTPLVVKLLDGTPTGGVVLAETHNVAKSIINSFKALNANLLVQEFVKEAEGKELRCLVINNKVVATIERISISIERRSNSRFETNTALIKISETERKLAVDAAKTLGLQVAGVDIIRSSKGPLLLDVNSSPGLEDIETATGNDIAGMVISSIEKKLKWKRELG